MLARLLAALLLAPPKGLRAQDAFPGAGPRLVPRPVAPRTAGRRPQREPPRTTRGEQPRPTKAHNCGLLEPPEWGAPEFWAPNPARVYRKKAGGA